MARRKHKGSHAPDKDALPPKAEKLTNNPFAAALADVKLPKRRKKKAPKKKKAPRVPDTPLPKVHRAGTRRRKKAPLSAYEEADQKIFELAFAGVEPLGGGGTDRKKPVDRERLAKRVAETAAASEAAARARLDALVGGGVHFEVRYHEDGGVEGRRRGAPDRTARMLASGDLTPTGHLDLHGQRTHTVASSIRTFVREQHRAGRRNLSVVHGKGSHSEGGQGVLRDAVVRALTSGGAAPLVDSFATAPRRFGGHGALLIRLRERAG